MDKIGLPGWKQKVEGFVLEKLVPLARPFYNFKIEMLAPETGNSTASDDVISGFCRLVSGIRNDEKQQHQVVTFVEVQDLSSSKTAPP